MTSVENRLQGQESLEKTQSMGVTFDVYSGSERYFNRQGKPGKKKEYFSAHEGNSTPHAMWVIKDSFGVFKVYPANTAYPFIGIPDYIPDSLQPKFTPLVVPPGKNDE